MITRAMPMAPAPPAPPAPAAPAPNAAAAPAPAAPSTDDYLAPDVVRNRTEQGRVAEYETGTLDPAVAAAGAPAYFRSYEQVKGAMYELAAKFPELVEVLDIGDSSEKVAGKADRDVLALRITAKGMNDGKKAGAFYIAGEHAREIANPELMMRFANELLTGYGSDPEATALLQTRVIDLVPIMNPDGHVVIEKGFAKEAGGNLMHRKNTAPPSGTDLNRNYEYHWGNGGSSTNPGSDTYRGPAAGSEPEVKAVEGHITKNRPGIFIDWHSYSQLNLFPWGDTRAKAPDYAGLDALAKKFSTYNHYTPEQSIELYPTSGTSKDWVYGTYKTPAFTVETGETFHQSDKEFEQVWAENSPVMRYSAKVADAPFQRVLGPDVGEVHVTAANAPGVGAREAKLAASVSDANNGGQLIAGAEYVLDPFAAPGSGTPLTAADGAFDSPTEQVGAVLAAVNGQQLVYVRAQDATGNWGPLTAQWMKG